MNNRKLETAHLAGEETAVNPARQGEAFITALVAPREGPPDLEQAHLRYVHFLDCENIDRLEGRNENHLGQIKRDFEGIISPIFTIAKDKKTGENASQIHHIGNAPTHGFTALIPLEASAVTVHTYPENHYRRRFTLNIEVCCKKSQIDDLQRKFGEYVGAKKMIVVVDSDTPLGTEVSPHELPFDSENESIPSPLPLETLSPRSPALTRDTPLSH